MVSGTSSSAILAGFLVRPKDVQENKTYYARNVTQFFKENSERFFEKRTINVGALWVVTALSGIMGAYVGYRLGVKIYANPQVETTIKELQAIIKDMKKIKKVRETTRQTRPAIQNDHEITRLEERRQKTFKRLLSKYGLKEELEKIDEEI